MNNQVGKLIVISGPSGAGKSTVISHAMRRLKNARFSVSATTREAREGEVDGVNYYFVTKEQFRDMIERGELLEYAEYVDNYYGTPKKPVIKNLSEGIDVILDIEVQGAEQVKRSYPQAVTVFLTPSSFSELEKRLRTRNEDDETKIRKRLETAKKEHELIQYYDYIVINDNIETSVNELISIITAEKCRMAARSNQIEMI